MSVRCLTIKYTTRKGLFVLCAQFGAVHNRRGELKTRFLKRRRVRYGSVETGAQCAPLRVGVNIAHRGDLLIHRSRGPPSPLGKANVLRTSPFSVIMLFRMIVGLLLASP